MHNVLVIILRIIAIIDEMFVVCQLQVRQRTLSVQSSIRKISFKMFKVGKITTGHSCQFVWHLPRCSCAIFRSQFWM